MREGPVCMRGKGALVEESLKEQKEKIDLDLVEEKEAKNLVTR